MEALKVTARLCSGFVSSDPWSPSLDGILAYWAMREREGDEEFALGGIVNQHLELVEGLPLEMVEHNGLRWYSASSPIYRAATVERRYYHRRFDDNHERFLDMGGKSGKVQTASGPYKNCRIPMTWRATGMVMWHAIGDADEVTRLLRPCTHIGAKTAQGFGRVREWHVERGGDEVVARTARPLPAAYASEQGLDGEQMMFGIAPPARCNVQLCVMPPC